MLKYLNLAKIYVQLSRIYIFLFMLGQLSYKGETKSDRIKHKEQMTKGRLREEELLYVLCWMPGWVIVHETVLIYGENKQPILLQKDSAAILVMFMSELALVGESKLPDWKEVDKWINNVWLLFFVEQFCGTR